jgi:hypothetical protein
MELFLPSSASKGLKLEAATRSNPHALLGLRLFSSRLGGR